MKTANNTVVKITYELRTEPNGEVKDAADRQSPFAFLFGHNNVLDKFEQNLVGLLPGNQFKFTLTPEEGYGEYDNEAVIELEKSTFSVDGVIQEEMLFVGNVIPLQDQHGNPFQGRVVNVSDDKITVDLNHPFAGKSLYFNGTIVDVREANPVEIEHGHVHDNGEHHHH
jgi:FKBP-type peptidyl-prolyl cis-trans isomerase SlyD